MPVSDPITVTCKWDYGYKVSFYPNDLVKEFFDKNTKIPGALGHYSDDYFFVNKSSDILYEPGKEYTIRINYEVSDNALKSRVV